MKKTPRKLAINLETIRTLSQLDLAGAVGGLDAQPVLDQSKGSCIANAVVIAPVTVDREQ